MEDVADIDVAIVGAGPAGSTLAALLASRGVSVALYDRDQFPRDKLCGEFLSYDALPILDALGVLHAIDAAPAPRITRARVIGARTYEFDLPHAARGVSRMFLDDLLLRTAQRSGAIVKQGETVTSLSSRAKSRDPLIGLDAGAPAGDPLRVSLWGAGNPACPAGPVETKGPDRQECLSPTMTSPATTPGGVHVSARVIVGAWGRWGRFDQQLNRGFVRDRSHRNFGFKRHFTGPATTSIDLYSFRNGYLGVNAVEGDITNICGLVHASRLAGHKGRWDAFVETIRGEEPRLDALFSRYEPAQETYLSSEPVIFRARSAVEGGVFMIGDASGIIDPLTGNGMAMAIQSALLAAPFILRKLENAPVDDEYRDAHRRFFAPRIAWSRRVAFLLSRPRLLDAMLTAVRSPKIGQLFLARTRASRDEVMRLADAWF